MLAVDSRAGGKYPKLARDIAEKHPAHKRTFTVCVHMYDLLLRKCDSISLLLE